MSSSRRSAAEPGLRLSICHPNGVSETVVVQPMTIGSGEGDAIQMSDKGLAFATISKTSDGVYRIVVKDKSPCILSIPSGELESELQLSDDVSFQIGETYFNVVATHDAPGLDIDWNSQCGFCGELIDGDGSAVCEGCGRDSIHLSTPEWEGWVPAKVGEYQLKEYLGMGGMGVVFKALDETDRLVAIKLMRKRGGGEIEGSRFDQEIKIAERISVHLNIVGLKKHGHEGGLRWMAMELIEGETLDQVLKSWRKDPPSVDTVKTILCGLVDGLRHLHQNEVIHRDLKPSNVFITSKGFVKIGDFGLSKRFSIEAMTALTMTGASIGTERYMSPEQRKGDKVGFDADIYSLGLIWQEMITGECHGGALSEFGNDSSFAEVWRVEGDLPSGWRECINDMLATKANNRPNLAEVKQIITAANEKQFDGFSAEEQYREQMIGSSTKDQMVGQQNPNRITDTLRKLTRVSWAYFLSLPRVARNFIWVTLGCLSILMVTNKCGDDSGDKDPQDPPVAKVEPAPKPSSAHELYTRGLRLFNGDGEPRNEISGLELIRDAAKQGHAEAQANIGFYYLAMENETEALNWLQMAAEQGNVYAQYQLGLMYYQGRVIKKNETKAADLFREAAIKGYADAQFARGYMLANGRGVPKDEKEAVNWYSKAAEQGNADAQFYLGKMRFKGQGGRRDEKEAVRLFTEAAKQGHAEGQYELGMRYLFGQGMEKSNQIIAKYWFELAAKQGNDKGQHELGMRYLYGVDVNGVIVGKNDTEAVKCFEQAAEQGYDKGQYELGMRYLKGEGVKKNVDKAKDWLRMAAEQGHKQAASELENM